MTNATPNSTKHGSLGALVVAGLLLTSCASPGTDATDVNITPVTQAPSDPEAGSSQNDAESGPNIDYYYADDVETEGTFVLAEDGIETTITMNAVGGIVTEQTTTNVFDYAAFDVSTAEEAQAVLEDMVITVDDVEGFEQDLDFGETAATQVTHIDFTTLDMGEVADVPGAMTDGVTEESVVSYEENRQMLLSFGFVEVETSTS